MRALLCCALLCASCATPLALRLAPNEAPPDGQPGQPLRAVFVQHTNFPQLSPLGIGSEVVIPTDEVGLYFVPDPRPLVLRLSVEPQTLPATASWFEGLEVRRSAFVPSLAPRFQRALDKE